MREGIFLTFILITVNYSQPDLSSIVYYQSLKSVQDDFLIKLGIKPLMHVVEIRAFSLDSVIVILTQIMNRANKGLNA